MYQLYFPVKSPPMRLNPDLSSPRNKARSLFESLRAEILAGRFSHAAKLPGSRQLARDLGIARGTVNMALAMLAAEGLIEIHPASGVRVAIRVKPATRQRARTAVKLSDWALRLPQQRAEGKSAYFAAGQLADEYFPEREWLHSVKEGRRNFGALSSGVEQSPAGLLELRAMVAAHLRYSRGLAARPENIVIVNGSMQAITLVAQLLLQKGEAGAFENPGFHGIRAAIVATGAAPLPLAVDSEGARVPGKKARLVVVTPASQFPTGVTMSHARRAQLLEYAGRVNAFVLEDDYDSEFTRFANAPQPLKLTDRDDRVIYVGSFSRTMFASLRLGYCLLPDALVGAFLRARQLYDSVPPAFSDQAAMAAFMRAGYYRRHLKRMNRIYSARHAVLLSRLQRSIGHLFDIQPSAAGLSLFARCKTTQAEFNRVGAALDAAGLGWQDVGRYYAGKAPAHAIFGFSHLDETQIYEAARKIALMNLRTAIFTPPQGNPR